MPEDYPIGYRKPPKETQFKPGQSGNPRGREKGSRGLKSDLETELKAKQTCYVNKEPMTGRQQQLAMRMLAMRAASGDLKAMQLLLPLIVQVLGTEDRGVSKEQLTPADQALLNALLGEEHNPATVGNALLEGGGEIHRKRCSRSTLRR